MQLETQILIQHNIYADGKTTWKTVFGIALSERTKAQNHIDTIITAE